MVFMQYLLTELSLINQKLFLFEGFPKFYILLKKILARSKKYISYCKYFYRILFNPIFFAEAVQKPRCFSIKKYPSSENFTTLFLLEAKKKPRT
jgi:hypothetical protein